MARHVMECLGMSRVTVVDGRVVDVTEPKIRRCPLFEKYRGIESIDEEAVRSNVEYRIGAFGMCTEGRETTMRDFLSFGVSETLSTGLRDGEFDAVVLAADGCGTAVVHDPDVVQGLGGRISGIVETEPIAAVVEAVGADNVLDPGTAAIDMPAGAEKAFAMGLSKVAVTTASVRDAETMRRRHGNSVVIALVHTTGISRDDAEEAFEVCDIVTACASQHLREIAKATPGVLMAGRGVPVYGVTLAGKRLVRRRLEITGRREWDPSQGEDPPYPLLRSIRLQREMGPRPQIDQRDPLLPQAPAELLVVGEHVGALLLGELHHRGVPGLHGRDDLVLPRKRQRGLGVPVVEVLQLADERARNNDPGLAQQVLQGEVQVYPDLERHQ